MHSILITGATGFVGRPLCEELLSRAMRVRGIVRSTDLPTELPAGTDVVMLKSLGPDTDWSEALAGVDTVVHLAARVHMMTEPDGDLLALYRQVNVAGTERLARAAAAAGTRRLVFLSSVKVLGEETAVPYSEENAPSPFDPYAVSKWEGEQVLARVAKETGLEVVILRPPLVYGPGVKANFLSLLKIVRTGIPLPLGSIENRRSLIYLGNLIDAIAAAITLTNAAGQTFHVSDGEDVSTPELVRRIAAAQGHVARLIPFPPPLMRIVSKLTARTATADRLLGSLVVDSGKIRRELGWVPPFSLDQGLRATAQWHESVC